MITQKKLSYFNLIPHDPSSVIQEPKQRYFHLQLFVFLVKTAISALSDLYIKNKFTAFDPHVGDTLCQIRAAFIIYIAKNSGFDIKSYMITLENYLNRASLLLPVIETSIKLKRSKEERARQSHQTLHEFLTELELHLILPESIDYLVKASLLTDFKTHPLGISPRIDFQKLQKELDISKDMAARLVRYWQRELARYSSAFIESISKKYQPIVPLLKRQDDDSRDVLPCFFVMKQIIHFLIEQKMSLLFIIRHPTDMSASILTLSFRPKNNNFYLTDYIDIDEPHFVMHALSTQLSKHNFLLQRNLKQKIQQEGVINILEASVANHPQYSGKKLACLSENAYKQQLKNLEPGITYSLLEHLSNEYLKSLAYAKEEGCDYQNSIFVFIEHMLVDTPKSQFKQFGLEAEFNSADPSNTQTKENVILIQSSWVK